jgi:hypothetical protein
MFGKNKEKEAAKVEDEAAENKRQLEEIEAKRKQDYVDEKMKLSEKELFVELLWRMDELIGETSMTNKWLVDIDYNTKPENQPNYH